MVLGLDLVRTHSRHVISYNPRVSRVGSGRSTSFHCTGLEDTRVSCNIFTIHFSGSFVQYVLMVDWKVNLVCCTQHRKVQLPVVVQEQKREK